ncbi:MAG: hypothetical protein FJ012_05250 [Chloroflexi bacterium]|nr:hypothetical protein [Chloroflexota bacterium]
MAESLADVKIKMKFSIKDIISAIQELEPQKKEFFIENLLAATSPEYLESIKEAREDYRAGRVSTHEELFGKGDRK